MKKIYSISTFIFTVSFLSAVSFAQTTTIVGEVEGVDTKVTSGADISVDKEVHDYGTIEQGADGQCIFIVSNNGSEPLIISTCKGSCGCTVPQCPTQAILPGESAEITVKYNTNRVGPINKSVTINSNAQNEPVKIIKIAGNVKAKPQGGAPMNTGVGVPINN